MRNSERSSTSQEKPVLLVTGGAGFVGSHIVNRLSGRWRIRVLDDLSHGSPANIADSPDVSIHIGDIRCEADVRAAFAAGNVNAVVHCAAQTSVPLSMADAEFDREVNVVGTRHLVRAAAAARVRRFVFLSSGGAIYGETEAAAVESTFPAPRSHYGLHKFAAEHIIRAEGIPYAILRPSNVYGPRQRSDADGGVVAIFLERLLAGENIDLFGDGLQERDFVFVGDVVRAVEAALAVSRDVIWNVSSGASTSVLDLLAALSEISGVAPAVRRLAPREGDVGRSLLGRTTIAPHLPSPTPLREGLLLTLADLGWPARVPDQDAASLVSA